MRRPITPSLISIALLISACSTILGDTPTDSSPDSAPSGDTATGCIRFTGDHSTPIDTGSVATDALHLSGEAFICADDAVVVGEGDINQIAAASQLAAAMSGPLLFPHPRLAAELGRLKPDRIHLIGSPEVNVPSRAETVEHDVASALELTSETLGVTDEVSITATPDSSTIVETVLAIGDADRVAVPPTDGTNPTVTSEGDDVDESTVVTGLAVQPNFPSVWMVDAAEPETLLLAASVGHSLEASVMAFNGDDMLGYPQLARALEGRTGSDTRLVGSAPASADWELGVLANGAEVPGGGFHIFPEEEMRRYLAYYGHPGTESLGVLGRQGPAETFQEMQGFVSDYAGDGSTVIPTFEIIASVASGDATDDGDYSYEWPIDKLQPWIDHAEENDMYVVLDLQPGRDDFLSQAVQYEELLELPHVGLALDPEWRLGPDEVHLNQIGSVHAEEINETVNWVADLVRDNGLPQKMMIVHQFQTRMIQNREDIVERPEIEMVIQMDGDGTEAQKDGTWSQLLAGADDAHWEWGWKNFFEVDEPGPPSPQNTMNKVPTPVYVSYQ